MNKFEELFKFTSNAAFCGALSGGRRFLERQRPPVVKSCIAISEATGLRLESDRSSSYSSFLTSLSLVRTGCSLSELLRTYCSTGSTLLPPWGYEKKAACPKPERRETRAIVVLQASAVCRNPPSSRLTSYKSNSEENDHSLVRLHGVLD